MPKGRLKLLQKKKKKKNKTENIVTLSWFQWTSLESFSVLLVWKEIQLVCSWNEEGGSADNTLNGPFNSGLKQAKNT